MNKIIMPVISGPISNLFSELNLIHIDGDIDVNEITMMAKSPHIERIQTNKPLSSLSWKLINEVLLAVNPNIELRVFNFDEQGCDFSFLKYLPNLRNFSVDLIRKSHNLNAFENLQRIEKLKINISDLTSFNFLNLINKNLTSLKLYRTNSKKPDLKLLERFDDLKSILIDCHHKNLNVLENLNLEEISLQAMTLNDFNFLNEVKSLESLTITAIKSKNFDQLAELNRLKSLNVSHIREARELIYLAELKSLESLTLLYLNKVEQLPCMENLNKLLQVNISNLKSLNSLGSFKNCNSINEFSFSSSTKMDVENFRIIFNLKGLKKAFIGTGSHKKNKEIKELLRANGITEL